MELPQQRLGVNLNRVNIVQNTGEKYVNGYYN